MVKIIEDMGFGENGENPTALRAFAPPGTPNVGWGPKRP